MLKRTPDAKPVTDVIRSSPPPRQNIDVSEYWPFFQLTVVVAYAGNVGSGIPSRSRIFNRRELEKVERAKFG
jgi:hypothetical protein